MSRIFLLFLVIYSFNSFSQENELDTMEFNYPQIIGRNEIAYMCAGINYRNGFRFSNQMTSFEFLNNVMFRYRFNKGISMRIIGSFTDTKILEFKIGSGIQYTLLKKGEFIYSYFDLFYRRINANDVTYGSNVDPSYYRKTYTNGLDMVIGIGSKLKIFRNIYLSPEIGYNHLFAKSKEVSHTMSGGDKKFYSFSSQSKIFSAKIYLSVTF